MRIVNHITYDHTKQRLEQNNGISETIPGQSMSVPEMIKRSQRGLPVPGSRTPLYTGDIEIPDFSRMDIAELQEFKIQNDEIIREYEKQVKEHDKNEYRKKQQEAIDKEVAKRLAADKKPNSNSKVLENGPDDVD